MNPTKIKYNFQWVNEDDEDVKKHRCFECLIASDDLKPKSWHQNFLMELQPGRKTEVSVNKLFIFHKLDCFKFQLWNWLKFKSKQFQKWKFNMLYPCQFFWNSSVFAAIFLWIIQCAFQYVPAFFGKTESFWRFEIRQLNISIPFLFVGETHEPVITLDRAHFRYKPILLGMANSHFIFIGFYKIHF